MESWRKRWRAGSYGVAAAALALSMPPALAAAQQAERHSVPGERVAIYNLAGRIEVRGGGRGAVEIEVRRGGEDGARLTIARGTIEDFETLRILYPADRISYRLGGRSMRSELRVRDDGTFYHGSDGDRGRRVTVAADDRGLEAHADLAITVPPGKSLAVYLAVGEVTVSNLEGDLLVDVGAADVSTSGTRGGLIVDTGSGSVRISDAEGDVKADTGSGAVELDGVRGEQLIADTGSGSVRGSGIQATQVLVDTGSGGVDLSGVTATDIRVDTGSGAVRLDLLSDVNWLEVDTGSGAVTISVPDGFGAEIEVETGSGGIDFDLPIEVRKVQRSYLLGSVGDGQGRVVVDTGSGSVTLRRG